MRAGLISAGALLVLLLGAVLVFVIPRGEGEPDLPPPFDPSALSWVHVASTSPWAARDSAAAFVFDGKMWIAGGLNGNNTPAGPKHAVEYWNAPYFNDLWNSEDGERWKLAASSTAWAPRRSMSIVSFGDALWMFGGWSPSGGYESDIWRSRDGVTWTKVVAAAPWKPREGQWVEVFEGKLWMMGGVNYDARQTFNDVWYTEDGVTWQQAPDAPWAPRWDHATAVFDGKLWLTGGMDLGAHADDPFGDEWVSEDGLTWTLVGEEMPWPPRQGHLLVPHRGYLWLLGRLNDDVGGGENDVWHSRDGFAWTKGSAPGWSGREDFSALEFKDRLWVFSGMDASWRWRNDVWASISSPEAPTPPTLKAGYPLPSFSASAFIAMYIGPDGASQILAEKDAGSGHPVASLTKLMTALVASELYDDPADSVAISERARGVKGASGAYDSGDRLSLDAALHALLVASHNEVAEALAEKAGRDEFLRAMNAKASSLDLSSMRFVNPSGVDPASKTDPVNEASALDLARFVSYLYGELPALFAVTGTRSYTLHDTKGRLVALLTNTNELLEGAPLEVVGGKTGETPRAGQNLVVVSPSPAEGVVVSVILGSSDRAGEMWRLLEYVRTAYAW